MDYVDLKVRIDRELYRRLLVYAASKYGKVRGAVSEIIREAVEEYLERHAQ